MAKPRLDDLLDISFRLNDAVLDQDQWKGALQHLANVFGGSFATFELIDKKAGRHLQHLDSSELEIQDEYLRYYMEKNPRIAFGSQPNSPNLLHDALFISEQGMNRNEFYVDFLHAHDLKYFLSFKAFETSDETGVFTIQKSSRSGPANDDELLALMKMSSTFSKIANLQVKYHDLFGHIHDLEGMFEAVTDGVLILDSTGAIIEINQLATSMLSDRDGLTFSNGKPGCIDPHNDDRLNRLISNIADIKSLHIERQLLVSRQSGLPPYQIIAQSIAKSKMVLGGKGARTLLIIRDPAKSCSIGFTKAEANVSLSIADGNSVREIADATQTSLATIRTHIQRIMQKMSVNRQSEVARIISKYL